MRITIYGHARTHASARHTLKLSGWHLICGPGGAVFCFLFSLPPSCLLRSPGPPTYRDIKSRLPRITAVMVHTLHTCVGLRQAVLPVLSKNARRSGPSVKSEASPGPLSNLTCQTRPVKTQRTLGPLLSPPGNDKCEEMSRVTRCWM